MVVAGERPHGRPAIAWKEEWPEIAYVAKGWPQTSRGAQWRRRLQVPALVFRCLRLARKYRCAKLLVVFPSEEYLLAGYLVARLSGAQLYPYFHNTYVEQCEPNSVRSWFARRLQARVFARSSHIFMMSEGMVQFFRERYPGVKCSALIHSFNEDIPEYVMPDGFGTPLRFVLSGNINASCEEAVIRVCCAISQIDSTLTIFSGTAKAHLRQLGILQGNVRHEVVARDVMLKYLAEADIVLLAHGFKGALSKEEYDTIFPTRTIEYLISGRPILAHAPADCFLTKFLRKQRCALIVDIPTVDALLKGIQILREDAHLRSVLVRNALRTAELFRAPVVAASLRAVLERN